MTTALVLLVCVIAGYVLYQLYAVLGRRIGRMPADAEATPARGAPTRRSAVESDPTLSSPAAQSAVPVLKGWDQSFDLAAFLTGAKTAYERVVKAFVSGDRDTLRPLL